MRRGPALALAVATAAAACGGTQSPSRAPASTAVEAYIDAIEADDPRAAYELLSQRERETTSYEDFETAWREHPDERVRAADDLRALIADERDLGERAAVSLAGGERLYLSREGGEWTLDTPRFGAGRAPTPRDAITHFADALAAKSYPDLLRILTERRREAISERVHGLARGLDAHRDAPLERLADDRAALEFHDESARYRVILRKHDGEWRIDELHIMGLLERE